jgi:UDPglucose 6-dehydrogenase
LKLGVVGLGYAGLCTAACLATKFEVVGIDVDGGRVSSLNRGIAPIHEEGLPALLRSGDWIVSAVERALGRIKEKDIAILGVAFKEESDDVRESGAIVLAKKLLNKGARVRMSDSKALEGARRELGGRAKYLATAEESINGADAVIVMTAWNEFRRLKPRDFVTLMQTPFVFDARRVYRADEYRIGGVDFYAIGRGNPQ